MPVSPEADPVAALSSGVGMSASKHIPPSGLPEGPGATVYSLSNYGDPGLVRKGRLLPEGANAGMPQCLKILAVVDGTQESSRLLNFLLEIRGGSNVLEVIMVHCHRPAFIRRFGRLSTVQKANLHELTKRSRQFASRRLAAAGVKQSHRLFLGDPTDLVLEILAVQPCSLVVMTDSVVQTPIGRSLTRLGLAGMTPASRIQGRTTVPVCVIR